LAARSIGFDIRFASKVSRPDFRSSTIHRLLVLALTVALPSAALAKPYLLERQLTLGVLATDEPTPPPPPVSVETPPEGEASQPDAMLESAPLPPPPDVPGKGVVLGYLISGAAIASVGVYLLAYAAAFLLFGTVVSGADLIGIGILVAGLAHTGVGVSLLVIGNNKRLERNAYYDAVKTTERTVRPNLPILAFRF
jgi:hypothetical protein